MKTTKTTQKTRARKVETFRVDLTETANVGARLPLNTQRDIVWAALPVARKRIHKNERQFIARGVDAMTEEWEWLAIDVLSADEIEDVLPRALAALARNGYATTI